MVPTLIQGAVQNISYSTVANGTAISTWEAPGQTGTIRLCATSDCFYLISVAGTHATTGNGSLLPGGLIEYVRIPNQAIVSVVQSSASGTLNVTQVWDVSTPN